MNAWTEWGTLEAIVVGRVDDNCHAPVSEPGFNLHTGERRLDEMMNYPAGPRHPHRIKLAQEELKNFVEILEGECVKVHSKREFDKELQKEEEVIRS